MSVDSQLAIEHSPIRRNLPVKVSAYVNVLLTGKKLTLINVVNI